MNLTKQPLTVPERFIKGRCLRLKGGVIDRGEGGDQNALGFVSIGLIVVEKCTINCLNIIVRVPPWRYDDEQNADLVPVMVILDGAYHNGSNELGII